MKEKISNLLDIAIYKQQVKDLEKKVKKLELERIKLIDLKNKYLSDLRSKNLELGKLKKKMEKKEIEMLYKNLDAEDKIINEQALEIARLKKELEYLKSNEYLNQVKWERDFNENLVKELQQRIDKAIEYIKSHTNNCMFELRIEEIEELLTILGDKENE